LKHPLPEKPLKNFNGITIMFSVATGAKKAKRLNIPGEDLPAITDPLTFLSLAKQGQAPATGRHVIVIGGGNTAMDAARMAKKITGGNGNVTIVYRRTLAEMPAAYEEVEAALREGVEILTLTAPLQIIGICSWKSFASLSEDGTERNGRERASEAGEDRRLRI